METSLSENPTETVIAPRPSSEMELINISPPSEERGDSSTPRTGSAAFPVSVISEINNDIDSDIGLLHFSRTEEREGELQPLAASSSSRSNDEDFQPKSSPVPVTTTGAGAAPIIPKNRRRPGSSSDGTKVMMTGTVLQGSSGGQPVEVEVELSDREFQRLTSTSRESRQVKQEPCACGRAQGPHVVILSFLCIPIALVISWCLSFYNGSITWYNLFIYYSEEKSVVHRLTVGPLLLLSFPITVGLSTIIISIAASFIQISWSWIRWKREFLDGEKGFYGWFCNKMQLPDCSPYQVVILEEGF